MTKAAIAALALFALSLAAASPAPADVGVVSAKPATGASGDRVELTLGCGFCFPPCVGEPGDRHPPGEQHGVCMPGDHGAPPASFKIWLTPLGHSLRPYRCRSGHSCEAGSSRPPHLPSFVYLGRALPVPAGGAQARAVPRYRLGFGVPEAKPGRYKYVVFCDACVDGPRGSLIEDRTAAGRLRVLPAQAPTAAAAGSAGAGPWVAGGIAAAVLALGAGFFLLRRGGPAARRSA